MTVRIIDISTGQETVRNYTQAELDAIAALPEPELPVIKLTPRQIRQALTALDLRTLVEEAIAVSSQDMKDWWEFAQTFERNHPLVIGMGQALDKTPDELDALFEYGATL